MTLSGLHATNTPAESAEITGRAISLAHGACSSHTSRYQSSSQAITSTGRPAGESGVVLSLGPFGAHLKPSQEYAGVYPSPYGPTPTASTSGASSTTPNYFPTTSSGRVEEARAEVALAQWHLDRLRAFASAPSSAASSISAITQRPAEQGESGSASAAWDNLEWVAFETVPLLTEIRAVRRAMAVLNREIESGRRKKFWICSAFPEGRFPQRKATTSSPSTDSDAEIAGEAAEAGHVGMDEWLAAAIGPLQPLALDDPSTASTSEYADAAQLASLGADDIPSADGIGINYTSPAYLPGLAHDMTEALAHRPQAESHARPALVLYPDRGAVYDTTTKKWTNRTSGAEDWARDVSAVVREAAAATLSEDGEHVWAGVIVGGCCKAGFDEIRLLKEELQSKV